MRGIVAVLCLLIAGGCEQSLLDSPAPPIVPNAARSADRVSSDSIYDAASNALPFDAADGFIVGVLDRGRTPNSVRVSFENSREWAIYEFVRTEGSWIRGEIESSGEVVPRPAVGSGPAQVSGYSGIIAMIRNGNAVQDEWYVSNLDEPGFHYAYEEYFGLPIDNAWFIPGSYVDDGTLYRTSLDEWRAFRINSPSCDPYYWESSNNPYYPGLCFTGSSWISAAPQAFQLVYKFEALAPPQFTVFDYEPNHSDYRAFMISPLSFGTPVESVVWETSTNGTNWFEIDSSSCGQLYAGAFRWAEVSPQLFRATLTLTDGRHATKESLYNSYGGAELDLEDVYEMC